MAEATLNITPIVDLRVLQMLGHAVRGVEIAAAHDCATAQEAAETYLGEMSSANGEFISRGDEMRMLETLIAGALTRMMEIR